MRWQNTGKEKHATGKSRRNGRTLEAVEGYEFQAGAFGKRMAVWVRICPFLIGLVLASAFFNSCRGYEEQTFDEAVTEFRREVQTETPENLQLRVITGNDQEDQTCGDPLAFVYEDGKLSLDIWQDCFGCMDLAYREEKVEWEDGACSYCADDYERAIYRIYSLDEAPQVLREFDFTELLQESDYRILWGVDDDLYQVRREQGDFVLYVGAWRLPDTEEAFRENGEWIRIDLESQELTALGRSAGVFWSADPEDAEAVRTDYIEAEWHSNNLASTHLTEDLWEKNHLGEVSRKIRYSFREQENACMQGSPEDGKLDQKANEKAYESSGKSSAGISEKISEEIPEEIPGETASVCSADISGSPYLDLSFPLALLSQNKECRLVQKLPALGELQTEAAMDLAADAEEKRVQLIFFDLPTEEEQMLLFLPEDEEIDFSGERMAASESADGKEHEIHSLDDCCRAHYGCDHKEAPPESFLSRYWT